MVQLPFYVSFGPEDGRAEIDARLHELSRLAVKTGYLGLRVIRYTRKPNGGLVVLVCFVNKTEVLSGRKVVASPDGSDGACLVG